MPRREPTREELLADLSLKTESIYDSVQVAGPHQLVDGQRLFGNRNIGMFELCNLETAGQMPGDYYFIVQRWYARTNIPERSDSFSIWAHSTPITFIVGHRPLWTLSLRELLDRRPRTDEARPSRLVEGDPWPILIPERQTFTAQIDTTSLGALDEVRRWLGNHSMFQSGTGVYPLVWLHLEGVRVPSTIPSAKIFGLFTAIDRQRRSAADEIVAWITGMVADPTIADEHKATMGVITDGIIEGKHRR